MKKAGKTPETSGSKPVIADRRINIIIKIENNRKNGFLLPGDGVLQEIILCYNKFIEANSENAYRREKHENGTWFL